MLSIRILKLVLLSSINILTVLSLDTIFETLGSLSRDNTTGFKVTRIFDLVQQDIKISSMLKDTKSDHMMALFAFINQDDNDQETISLPYHMVESFVFPWINNVIPVIQKTMLEIRDSTFQTVELFTKSNGDWIINAGSGEQVKVIGNPIVCTNGFLIVTDRPFPLPKSLVQVLKTEKALGFLKMWMESDYATHDIVTLLVPPEPKTQLALNNLPKGLLNSWFQRYVVINETVVFGQHPGQQLTFKTNGFEYGIRWHDNHSVWINDNLSSLLKENVHVTEGIIHFLDSAIWSPEENLFFMSLANFEAGATSNSNDPQPTSLLVALLSYLFIIMMG